MAGFFNKVRAGVHEAYVKTATSVMGTLTDETKFFQEGVLTPEQFVAAGDLLVRNCGTWSWEAGQPKKRVSYLPDDKQFLITRNVPCKKFDGTNAPANTIVEDDWMSLTYGDEANGEDDIVDIEEKAIPAEDPEDDDDDDDDDDIPDADDWDEEDNLEDADPGLAEPATENSIIKMRTYDITITYDKYYQTPKVWLFGYDENRQPLAAKAIYTDLSVDHAKKTVTMDSHPHLGIQFAYIHPCRHASVMKKMIGNSMSMGVQPRVDQYLILFLKFLAVVMPNIEYDYTVEVEQQTQEK